MQVKDCCSSVTPPWAGTMPTRSVNVMLHFTLIHELELLHLRQKLTPNLEEQSTSFCYLFLFFILILLYSFYCTTEGPNGHSFYCDYSLYNHMWQIKSFISLGKSVSHNNCREEAYNKYGPGYKFAAVKNPSKYIINK